MGNNFDCREFYCCKVYSFCSVLSFVSDSLNPVFEFMSFVEISQIRKRMIFRFIGGVDCHDDTIKLYGGMYQVMRILLFFIDLELPRWMNPLVF